MCVEWLRDIMCVECEWMNEQHITAIGHYSHEVWVVRHSHINSEERLENRTANSEVKTKTQATR